MSMGCKMSSLLNYDSMNLGSANETSPKLETDFGNEQGVEKMIPTWYQHTLASACCLDFEDIL